LQFAVDHAGANDQPLRIDHSDASFTVAPLRCAPPEITAAPDSGKLAAVWCGWLCWQLNCAVDLLVKIGGKYAALVIFHQVAVLEHLHIVDNLEVGKT